MVFKPTPQNIVNTLMFESDVISDGIQTLKAIFQRLTAFESDVISDGIQTIFALLVVLHSLRVM